MIHRIFFAALCWVSIAQTSQPSHAPHLNDSKQLIEQLHNMRYELKLESEKGFKERTHLWQQLVINCLLHGCDVEHQASIEKIIEKDTTGGAKKIMNLRKEITKLETLMSEKGISFESVPFPKFLQYEK